MQRSALTLRLCHCKISSGTSAFRRKKGLIIFGWYQTKMTTVIVGSVETELNGTHWLKIEWVLVHLSFSFQILSLMNFRVMQFQTFDLLSQNDKECLEFRFCFCWFRQFEKKCFAQGSPFFVMSESKNWSNFGCQPIRKQ